MLRMEAETGWWLIRHPDHARLAGAFASQWGNDRFRKPEPRARVLQGIATHDDGWAERDAHPTITRQGKPSAFSIELVGKYSAFEEIDLAEYLAVRDRAVRIVAERDPYAGLLIALHTYNLLSEHADRSTIAPEGLELLDRFLEQQRIFQHSLRMAIALDETLTPTQRSEHAVLEHFRLLQACDNLSLLACVDFDRPADLLHRLPQCDGGASEVKVWPLGSRRFRLDPWPFAEKALTFGFPARKVAGKIFRSSAELEYVYNRAQEEELTVTLLASA